jgi:uncharacterized protein YbjT (DUF2867 family)
VIAVTGSTGALGARVAAGLAAGGEEPVRLVVRDAVWAPGLPGTEVAENPGGYADGPACRLPWPGRRPSPTWSRD